MTLVRALLMTNHVTSLALESTFKPDLFIAEVAECGSCELDADEAVVTARLAFVQFNKFAD